MIGVFVSIDAWVLMASMSDIPFRGFSSRDAEKITDSGRLVLRWREPYPRVSCKFYRDVAAGAADHGQRSQEEIWSLSTFHGLCCVCYRALLSTFLYLVPALMPPL